MITIKPKHALNLTKDRFQQPLNYHLKNDPSIKITLPDDFFKDKPYSESQDLRLIQINNKFAATMYLAYLSDIYQLCIQKQAPAILRDMFKTMERELMQKYELLQ